MQPSDDCETPPYHDAAVSPNEGPSHALHVQESPSNDAPATQHHRVYKRRWFGLVQLTLLNIVVSWDWLTFAPVSTTSAEYFDVPVTAINWLSTGFLFAFVVASPVTILVLNRGGPKPATVACSVLILLGNWLRYAGTRARSNNSAGGVFGLVMFGQILIGLVG